VVRWPHISIDVRPGEAYALSVEEAVEYNPQLHKPCHSAAPARARHLCGAPQYNTSYVSCDLHGLLKNTCALARHIRSYPFWVK